MGFFDRLFGKPSESEEGERERGNEQARAAFEKRLRELI